MSGHFNLVIYLNTIFTVLNISKMIHVFSTNCIHSAGLGEGNLHKAGSLGWCNQVASLILSPWPVKHNRGLDYRQWILLKWFHKYLKSV
jgi:hypothetical protein